MLKPTGEGNSDYLKVTECTGKRWKYIKFDGFMFEVGGKERSSVS